MRRTRIPVGFWCVPDHHDPVQDMARDLGLMVARWLKTPHYPHPREMVDRTWSTLERDLVALYLQRGEVIERYFGEAQCRMCPPRHRRWP
jgi:hypothetical protein